jgi:hypothetical protein
MAVNGSSTVLVDGNAMGMLTFRSIWNLHPLRIINVSEHGALTFLGFSDGTLIL